MSLMRRVQLAARPLMLQVISTITVTNERLGSPLKIILNLFVKIFPARKCLCFKLICKYFLGEARWIPGLKCHLVLRGIIFPGNTLIKLMMISLILYSHPPSCQETTKQNTHRLPRQNIYKVWERARPILVFAGLPTTHQATPWTNHSPLDYTSSDIVIGMMQY